MYIHTHIFISKAEALVATSRSSYALLAAGLGGSSAESRPFYDVYGSSCVKVTWYVMYMIYLCICMCTYIYIYIYMYENVYVYVYICIRIYTYIYIFIHVYVCMYMYKYKHVCI